MTNQDEIAKVKAIAKEAFTVMQTKPMDDGNRAARTAIASICGILEYKEILAKYQAKWAAEGKP
jgi:hypothetical protein